MDYGEAFDDICPPRPDPAQYTIWLDGYTEGWHPYEFDTVAECFDHMRSCAHSGPYRITRDVQVEIREVPA
jgi:hypothetical protein